MLVVRTKVVKTDGMIKIVGRIMAPSSLRALWPPYLTVPAKDGLSSRGLNLADTAHGGRGGGRGGTATTTCGAMAISGPRGIKVGNGTPTWGWIVG